MRGRAKAAPAGRKRSARSAKSRSRIQDLASAFVIGRESVESPNGRKSTEGPISTSGRRDRANIAKSRWRIRDQIKGTAGSRGTAVNAQVMIGLARTASDPSHSGAGPGRRRRRATLSPRFRLSRRRGHPKPAPMIGILIESMPAPGSTWPHAARAQWLTVLERTLDALYPGER